MKISIVLDFIYKKRMEYMLSIMAGVFLFYFFDTYVLEYDLVFTRGAATFDFVPICAIFLLQKVLIQKLMVYR